ncbi:hypothetical protein [Bacillus sp. V5-8f]|uniref:hypothetical protein n=1 Tax=Bacillus sp. V5-8f TaxID=2053044 RepID=UPI000C760B91|nr:hypothetical protein [Bacillus sp. V5-8f]PLT31964.1 hypothetical protein CUU64_20465 [Bacillus sp. V5-8f]
MKKVISILIAFSLALGVFCLPGASKTEAASVKGVTKYSTTKYAERLYYNSAVTKSVLKEIEKQLDKNKSLNKVKHPKRMCF